MFIATRRRRRLAAQTADAPPAAARPLVQQLVPHAARTATMADSRPLAKQADKESVWAELVEMYNDGSGYGEMSQEAHGLQTAAQAEQAGEDAATITAGLLHDIGWKLARPPMQEENSAFEGSADSIAAMEGILSFCAVTGASEEQQRAQHDVIGSTWLQMRGLEYKVAHLVEGHVLAKRYLTGTDESYASMLSSGSERTLKFQGGARQPAPRVSLDTRTITHARTWGPPTHPPTHTHARQVYIGHAGQFHSPSIRVCPLPYRFRPNG